MNLSAENIGKIGDLARSGYPLKARDAQDLQGHNDHLTQLLEARFRLMMSVEIERDQLRAEVDQAKLIGRLAYNFDNYKQALDERDRLKAECEGLRVDALRYRWVKLNSSVMLKKTVSYRLDGVYVSTIYPPSSELDAAIDAAMGKGERS